MEPLLHYVLPLTALILSGEKPRTAATMSLLGVLSDMDALILVHRSLTHSLVVICLFFTPLILSAKIIRPEILRLVYSALFVMISHPILDLGSLTPILWPVLRDSYSLSLSLNGVIGTGLSLVPHVNVQSAPTEFTKHMSVDYPLFTQDGVLITLIIVLPLLYTWMKQGEK